jgi:hypothetical protein
VLFLGVVAPVHDTVFGFPKPVAFFQK